MEFFASKAAVAVCVEDLLSRSDIDWQSITIIRPEKSEVYCVHIVTDTLLEEVAKDIQQRYSTVLTNTSVKITKGG
jgi:hypothetical protein